MPPNEGMLAHKPMNARRGPHQTRMTRPPKAPCWRDFIQESKSDPTFGSNGKVLTFTDISTSPRSNSPRKSDPRRIDTRPSSRIPHASNSLDNRHIKRTKTKLGSKLHRTNSQATLGNLPQPDKMTVTLADTNPKEFGLVKDRPFDGRVYLDDNARRCEQWLQTVQAATIERPLATDLDFRQGSGDEIEIPEETWIDLGQLPHNRKKGRHPSSPPSNNLKSEKGNAKTKVAPSNRRKSKHHQEKAVYTSSHKDSQRNLKTSSVSSSSSSKSKPDEKCSPPNVHKQSNKK